MVCRQLGTLYLAPSSPSLTLDSFTDSQISKRVVITFLHYRQPIFSWLRSSITISSNRGEVKWKLDTFICYLMVSKQVVFFIRLRRRIIHLDEQIGEIIRRERWGEVLGVLVEIIREKRPFIESNIFPFYSSLQRYIQTLSHSTSWWNSARSTGTLFSSVSLRYHGSHDWSHFLWVGDAKQGWSTSKRRRLPYFHKRGL